MYFKNLAIITLSQPLENRDRPDNLLEPRLSQQILQSRVLGSLKNPE